MIHTNYGVCCNEPTAVIAIGYGCGVTLGNGFVIGYDCCVTLVILFCHWVGLALCVTELSFAIGYNCCVMHVMFYCYRVRLWRDVL